MTDNSANYSNLTGASPTMKNISKPALLALQFPLPPLDVQEKIVFEIEVKRTQSRSLLEMAQKNRENLAGQIEKLILGTLSVEEL